MKKTALLALLALPLASMAQKEFKITGNIKALKNGDKVFLVYQTDKRVTDSAVVTNGAFAFKGTVTDPVSGNLFLNKNPYVNRPKQGEVLDYASLYLEPANISVSAADSLKHIKVAGSAVNTDDSRLKEALKPATEQLKAIDAEFRKLTPEQQKDEKLTAALEEKYNKAEALQTPIYLDFVKKNPNSYVSLVSLSRLASDEDNLAAVEKSFATLPATSKASKLGKSLSDQIATAKKTGVGVMAMDFTQNDPDGKAVKLSDFKGKYVLVDFWASWCGPCRAENPNVVKAFNQYKDKNFTVLGVSLDRPGKKDDWLKAIKDDGLAWTHVSDLQFWDNAAAKMYGVRGIPANFLIDPTGKIVGKNLRGAALEKKLAEVVK